MLNEKSKGGARIEDMNWTKVLARLSLLEERITNIELNCKCLNNGKESVDGSDGNGI